MCPLLSETCSWKENMLPPLANIQEKLTSCFGWSFLITLTMWTLKENISKQIFLSVKTLSLKQKKKWRLKLCDLWLSGWASSWNAVSSGFNSHNCLIVHANRINIILNISKILLSLIRGMNLMKPWFPRPPHNHVEWGTCLPGKDSIDTPSSFQGRWSGFRRPPWGHLKWGR